MKRNQIKNIIMLIARIKSKIIFGFIYYFLITPIALIFKVFGRDHLQLGFSPQLNTYRNIDIKTSGDFDKPY